MKECAVYNSFVPFFSKSFVRNISGVDKYLKSFGRDIHRNAR
jgi:hypothetical protein